MQANNPKWIFFLLTSSLVVFICLPLQAAAKDKDISSWGKLINEVSKTNPDFISYGNGKNTSPSKNKKSNKKLSKKEQLKPEKEEKKVPKKPKKLTAKELRKLDRKLYKAVKAGDYGKVREYIVQHADPNYSDRRGMSLLHIAAGRGFGKIVLLLTGRGADVHAETVKRWTPLHHAARFGHTQIVRHLLIKGAERNKRNTDGKTPYLLARQLRHTETIKFFHLWNKYH